MTQQTKNPFVYGRIEYEMNPTLYLTPSIFEYASKQPIIFTGIRGTGKSSILKSLTWEVAWKIEEMKICAIPVVQAMFRHPKHLGVNIRFEEMDVGYWESWKEDCGEDCAQKYFGTYIEMVLLDRFLNAMQEIRRKSKKYFLNAKAESDFIKSMVNVCFPSKQFRLSLFNFSFESLRSIVQDTHMGIRELVYRKTEEALIKQSYPIVGPGDIIQFFGELFIRHYKDLSDWTLMPLLDDCHLLSEWQTKVINSSIVKSKAPIAYKLTSVTGLYKSKLNIANRPLNEHDLKTIYMSYGGPKDKKYQDLVKGVCKARIEKYFNKRYSSQFKLKKILGQFNLEKLLINKFEKSENRGAIELLRKAKSIAEDKQKSISITSVWLSDKNIRDEKEIEDDDPFVQEKMMKRNESSYKKKFKYVAAVAICKEFHFDFPYSGWTALLNLSSGSIREVLRIMFEIWENAAMDIDQFIAQKPLKSKIQTQAINRASNLSFNTIDEKLIYRKSSFQKICKRLGKLFSKFQSYPYLCTIPESSSVRTKSTVNDKEVIDIIDQFVKLGFMLKKENEEKDIVTIGLHPILAPSFGISFRNPFYYPESITAQQMKIIFQGNDQDATRVAEEILSNRLNRYNKKYDKKLKKIGEKFKSLKQTEFNFQWRIGK